MATRYLDYKLAVRIFVFKRDVNFLFSSLPRLICLFERLLTRGKMTSDTSQASTTAALSLGRYSITFLAGERFYQRSAKDNKSDPWPGPQCGGRDWLMLWSIVCGLSHYLQTTPSPLINISISSQSHRPGHKQQKPNPLNYPAWFTSQIWVWPVLRML